MKTFENFSAYSEYYETHEHKPNTVDFIAENGMLKADGTFTCKNIMTAVRRFFKAVASVQDLVEWAETWQEEYEITGRIGQVERGEFSYGVEFIDDNEIYVWLNCHDWTYTTEITETTKNTDTTENTDTTDTTENTDTTDTTDTTENTDTTDTTRRRRKNAHSAPFCKIA